MSFPINETLDDLMGWLDLHINRDSTKLFVCHDLHKMAPTDRTFINETLNF